MRTSDTSRVGILIAVFAFTSLAAAVTTSSPGIVDLQCDSLVEPLGIDDAQPLFSWRLHDGRWGAAQTGYRIQVASNAALLVDNRADVWDSGRVASDRSVNVSYGGSALAPETRYYWRVSVWDKDQHLYPTSAISWWETGLGKAENWTAKWIGYEDLEHKSIRESGAAWITNPDIPGFAGTGDTHHNFRFRFNVSKPVKRAILYLTGQDTAAAWIDGRQVLEAHPLPPWHQMPWQTYEEKDVTPVLHKGPNLLAIAITHYSVPSANSTPSSARTPMSACLYIEADDDSIALFTSSSQGWKSALNATAE